MKKLKVVIVVKNLRKVNKYIKIDSITDNLSF